MTEEEAARKIRENAVRRITGFQPLDGSGKEEVEAFELAALSILRTYGHERERLALERAAKVLTEHADTFQSWPLNADKRKAELQALAVAIRIGSARR